MWEFYDLNLLSSEIVLDSLLAVVLKYWEKQELFSLFIYLRVFYSLYSAYLVL